MPNITLRLDPRQHAELVRRSKLAGLTLSDYIRQAALAEDTASLLRDIHAVVVGGNGHGLGAEAADAAAALVGLGVSPATARRSVEAIVTANPKAGAAEIIKIHYERTAT